MRAKKSRPDRAIKRVLCPILLIVLAWLSAGAIRRVVALPDDLDPARDACVVTAWRGEVLRVFRNRRDQLFIPTRLSRVHSNITRAVVGVEDRRFFSHPGVDPLAILRAAWTNLTTRGKRVGASTITMQLARLLAPAPRTLGNKLREALRALDLERRYSKKQILEMYLNLLPFGGNIVGVETAARIYFGKTAENLAPLEAALLAGLPKNPNEYHPLRHPERAKARRDFVLARLGQVETGRGHGGSLAGYHPLPFHAPHWAELIRAGGRRGILRTSLDFDVQRACERLAKTHASRLNERGVANLCLLVLSTRDSSVLGYIGSQDWFDSAHGGQVQGPLALRSPGSALKPFLYLLAFDRGLINPETRLEDVPTHLLAMDPRNYDRSYSGFVSVREALKLSLNIPAVRLLATLRVETFQETLENFGISTLSKPPSFYGLGLVLGGCEVTLLELCNAFATLARGGRYLEPLFFPGEAKPAVRVMDPGAPYLVSQILEHRVGHFDGTNFSFKTGTSTNNRDSWCIGFNPEFVVGAWCGNFDGRGSAALIGLDAAFPIVAETFKSLYGGRPMPAREVPDGLEERLVCPESGLLPNRFCPSHITTRFLRGKTTTKSCELHRNVFCSPDGRESYCAGCLADHPFVTRVLAAYPPEIHRFFEQRGMIGGSMPPHFSSCPYHQAPRSWVKILEPIDGDRYFALPGGRISARVAAADTIKEVFLFLDDRLVRRMNTGESAFLEVARGRHTLVVFAEGGLTARSFFEVEGDPPLAP